MAADLVDRGLCSPAILEKTRRVIEASAPDGPAGQAKGASNG
jgi:hypothetical protein